MKKNCIKTGLCVLAMSSLCAMTSFASDDETKIGAMTIEISAN